MNQTLPFTKYQALGNDYLIVNPDDLPFELSGARIRRICDRHYGAGADGLLLGPYKSSGADFSLRLYNPDGTEFEKSGNGLRIFCRYLWDQGLVQSGPFTVATPGGIVSARILERGRRVSIDMGHITFKSTSIPVAGPVREVLNESLTAGKQVFQYCAASIGNPHCVVLNKQFKAGQVRKWGPRIETHPNFPQRINVQFMQVIDRETIRIEIWERGAGYTLASGSSSCAAAAVAHRLGLCGPRITVRMPGGSLDINIQTDWSITMTGAVARVMQGRLDAAVLQPDHDGGVL